MSLKPHKQGQVYRRNRQHLRARNTNAENEIDTSDDWLDDNAINDIMKMGIAKGESLPQNPIALPTNLRCTHKKMIRKPTRYADSRY